MMQSETDIKKTFDDEDDDGEDFKGFTAKDSAAATVAIKKLLVE